MKRVIIAILVLALMLPATLVVISGCSPATDYERTIVFYSSQGDKLQALTDIAIASFEAKFPGWKVEHVPVGDYDDVKDKIVTDFQGNQQPDLAYCYPDHVAQYIQTGKVVDLNKYMTSTEKIVATDKEGNATGESYTVGYSEEELADFLPGYYQEGFATNYTGYAEYGYSEDSLLTLPFVKSTELMYCNLDALKAAGLEPATTWDELWEQAAILKERYPTCTPLGYDSESNWFITMCEQNGWGYTSADANNHYLFNNSDVEGWLTEIQEYYDMGYITTKEDYNGQYTSTLFVKGVENGGLVYCIGSSGGASYQATNNFKWGVTSIPGSVREDGTVDYSVISQGPSLVMLTGGHDVTNATEKEKMTFMFIKELLDPTFQAGYAMESGYSPSRASVYEIPQYAQHMNGATITAVAAKVASSLSDRFFVSPAFVGSSTARTQVGNVLLHSMTGRKTPAKALQDAYAYCGGK